MSSPWLVSAVLVMRNLSAFNAALLREMDQNTLVKLSFHGKMLMILKISRHQLRSISGTVNLRSFDLENEHNQVSSGSAERSRRSSGSDAEHPTVPDLDPALSACALR